MHRLVGFQNCEQQLLSAKSKPDDAPPEAFKCFFLRIYDYYERALSNLYRECPHLRCPYEILIMLAAAYNVGPSHGLPSPPRFRQPFIRHLCYHGARSLRSQERRPPGAARAGLVMEFPPRATVLMHYNLRIQQGETRYSFTQYAAGSLFPTSIMEGGLTGRWWRT
jgi:hypothetical protein